MLSSIHKILKKYWGYDSFRPVQEDIINSVLEGRDTLALLPTGGGKSICFQIPAIAFEGICIVISPLIALMKDQVGQLQKRNIAAQAIYSGLRKKEIDILLDNCIYGKIKFLYISPERLKSSLFLERAKKMNISLLAIDEAHCISQWGYDFRPSYLKITDFRKTILDVPCIALTATATKEVKVDIQDKLNFKPDANIFVKSFVRENLSYSTFKEENKNRRLVEIISKVQGTAVVYVNSRKRTKEITDFLRRNKISADFYHAGLSHKERSDKQEDWINNRTRVIVATNAFGMGIDKADVRLVTHMNLTNSLEAYYQEAGRAGRDEKTAYATLLYNNEDIDILRKQIENAYPLGKEIKQVYQALANYYKLATGSGFMVSFDFDLQDFVRTYNLSYLTTFYCLKRLEDQGFIQLNEAFNTSSKMMFTITNENLYSFQLSNASLDPLIKVLLRQYGGELFTNYLNISEKDVALILKKSKDQVSKMLQILNQYKVIIYIPQKDKPQLTFITERFIAAKLPINKKLLQDRKKQEKAKIESVISYIQNEKRCRTISLLEYFNEITDHNCAVCDICLKRKKQQKFNSKQQRYDHKILSLFKGEKQLKIEDIVALFSSSDKQIILNTIRNLIESGELKYNEKGKLFMMDN